MDVKLSMRRMAREPVQAALSTLALGTGLAATTLVLTLVRSVLFAPLPFDAPDRLVRLIEVDSGGGRFYPSKASPPDIAPLATGPDVAPHAARRRAGRRAPPVGLRPAMKCPLRRLTDLVI
jgi:hypothetical protein